LRSIAGALDRPYGIPHLNILLPVGISFYTFQSLSYLIDVYRGDTEVERNPGMLSLYVGFFPLVVSGPIERSTRLLPQLKDPRRFDYDRVTNGLRLIFWGFFKKLVIADRLAPFVNTVFDNPDAHSGAPVLIAVYFFAFQIYADFSAYTDIAIGCARILGYDVMENFRRPYLAESVRTFWHRWHISLTTWLRDYLYIPLGGNRVDPWRWYVNIMIVFLLSGAWHGANWTFICWGMLHGLFLIASIGTATWRQRAVAAVELDDHPVIHEILRVLITFHLVTFAWIFFRAASLGDALLIIGKMADVSQSGGFLLAEPWNSGLLLAVACVMGLMTVEILQEKLSLGEWLASQCTPIRWGVYYLLVTILLTWGTFSSDEPFIYTQF
jgi:alginate O-acetyltransferase complex protein AlgI